MSQRDKPPSHLKQKFGFRQKTSRPKKRHVCRTPPLSVRKRLSAPQLFRDKGCGPPTANCQPRSRQCRQPNTTSLLRSRVRLNVRRVFEYLRWYSCSIALLG